ncbi:type IV pilin protein [Pelagibaculum spongiae]|uniref:Prepilin-type cleavage/methylation domain-containing protein n=1 Tax=Pelagibaculum spongiae TaxID=2080658 RepID=A0A2V1GVS8_9GAMM|nr:type IV pilin protein [Pelagibaculum spongiae]PVZ70428.1 hypothetical protein DC094_07505 [Pelagibaculum spongiae]
MNKKNKKGITLIELMIVIAIVAILAAIAWPSYQSSLQRGFRTQAMTLLGDIQAGQERFHSNAKKYTNDFLDLGMSTVSTSSITAADGRYEIQLTADNTSYSIVAIPKLSQVSDHCKRYLLNSLGQKRLASTGTTADSALPTSRCWAK